MIKCRMCVRFCKRGERIAYKLLTVTCAVHIHEKQPANMQYAENL